jgi:hypothetical protein
MKKRGATKENTGVKFGTQTIKIRLPRKALVGTKKTENVLDTSEDAKRHVCGQKSKIARGTELIKA